MESSAPKGSLSPPSSEQWPIIDMILVAPKTAHARGQPYGGIFVVGVSYSFGPGSTRPVDGLLTFSMSSLWQLAQPHDVTLILTLEVRWYLMKRILVDSGSAADLMYLPFLIRLGYTLDNLCNLGRILVRFNDTQTHLLGEIMLPISAGPITVMVPLIVINEPSNFNTILGHTWIHAMKGLPSSYHQRLSFLTP